MVARGGRISASDLPGGPDCRRRVNVQRCSATSRNASTSGFTDRVAAAVELPSLGAVGKTEAQTLDDRAEFRHLSNCSEAAVSRPSL
jgi:hypothetical protein